ncbi:MAG TPA: DcrB-related protein [Blastocatellia bacterium]|nr:DcrB-related protein [Blastocatellia bacterium]
MKQYFLNEGTIKVPESWPDQTVNIFPEPAGDVPQCSLVISRGDVSNGEDLNSYVSRQLDLLEKTLPGMELIRVDDAILDGERARDAEYTWIADEKKFRQRQVSVRWNQQVLVLTGTVLEDLYIEQAMLLQEMIFSFKFRPE